MRLAGRIATVGAGLLRALGNDMAAYRFTPKYALLFLTFRCTNKCRTCSLWRRGRTERRGELDWPAWRGIIDKLRAAGTRSIEVFGGDALLRKDILFDLISYCTKNRIATYLPTNCNLLDRSTAQELVRSGLKTIYFSLDGVGEEQDLIRGMDKGYDKVRGAIENVAAFRKDGAYPEIKVLTTVSRLNVGSLPSLINRVSSLPIDCQQVNYVCEVTQQEMDRSSVRGIKPNPYFVSTDGDSHLLSSEEALSFKALIDTLWKPENQTRVPLDLNSVILLKSDDFVTGEYPPSKCLRCRCDLTVSPFGEISPCPFYNEYILGNLCHDELQNCWGSDYHRAFVNEQREGRLAICRHCHMRMWKTGIRLAARRLVDAARRRWHK